MARTMVLLATLALVSLIAFVSVRVGIQEGFDDPVVIFSLVIVVVIAVGALGALTERGR